NNAKRRDYFFDSGPDSRSIRFQWCCWRSILDCSCAACSSRNLHRSLFFDRQTRTACGLKSPFTMRFVMADRDGGTGSVTVVVRLTMVVRASLTNFGQKHIAVLSARADPKRLSTGTSVFM